MEKKKISENKTWKYQMRKRTETRISTFYWKIETKSPKMFFYFYQKMAHKKQFTVHDRRRKRKKKNEKKTLLESKIQTTRVYSVLFWYKCDNMENGTQNKYTNKIFLLNAIGCDLQCAQSLLLFIHFYRIFNSINKVLLYWIWWNLFENPRYWQIRFAWTEYRDYAAWMTFTLFRHLFSFFCECAAKNQKIQPTLRLKTETQLENWYLISIKWNHSKINIHLKWIIQNIFVFFPRRV